jgi:hypothetical protein
MEKRIFDAKKVPRLRLEVVVTGEKNVVTTTTAKLALPAELPSIEGQYEVWLQL